MPLTIVLADPHLRSAEAITRLLETQPGFSVVAMARDRTSAARMLRQHRPGVLLVDLGILDAGVNQLPLLQQASPGTRLVLMGMDDASTPSEEARRLGAERYLRKDASLDAWLAALRGEASADGQPR
jgi:DNA-binding NarL/FixJ family response regulator